jgi:AcrR family transcriptional regulator
MSRRTDPTTRPTLIEVAAKLLAEEGPRALTARRIASDAGTSTMVIYTHFEGMRGLIREIVLEGFTRLRAHLERVERTTDPVADMAVIGRAYRRNAVTNPHLYAAMFGGSSLGWFTLDGDDRAYGRCALEHVTDCAARCIQAGRFRPGDPDLVAHQMWSAVHGLATLELGEYLENPSTTDELFDAQMTGLMIGAGDEPVAACHSVSVSILRMVAEVD